MNIVRKQIDTIAQVLAPQKPDAKKIYRPFSFIVLTEEDGQPIAYNSLTGEIAELSDKEVALLKESEIQYTEDLAELIEKWYLVPVEHNDIQLSDEILSFVKLFEKKDGISKYTIFTTMDCNARCFYCYEMGRPRTPMTEQTARDVVEFIDKNAPSSRKVKLGWFGGEPLYNMSIIDVITSGLREKGIEYTSSMISNGYLFDDDIVRRAKEEWNLKTVQITLDGTEEVYNKAKAFVNSSGKNPFVIVTDNIERLLKADIAVKIRMNMGDHNTEDLFKLAEWLSERYAGEKKLFVYSHLLFDYKKDTVLSEHKSDRVRDMLSLEQKCRNLKLSYDGYVGKTVRRNFCMADRDGSVTITPSGKLGKCEHYTEGEFIGDIYTGITDTAKVEEFKERANTKELCKGCFAYPICIKLKKCPNNNKSGCSSAEKLLFAERLVIKVQNTYKKLKSEEKTKA